MAKMLKERMDERLVLTGHFWLGMYGNALLTLWDMDIGGDIEKWRYFGGEKGFMAVGMRSL